MSLVRVLVITMTLCAVRSAAADPEPRDLFDEAVGLFFEGQVAESARIFDRLVAAVPAAEPQLWQRGLALYYAGRFADGRKQFEVHRTVNPDDVENAAWHFLCVARLEGVEGARKHFIPIEGDSRVPMKERSRAACVIVAQQRQNAHCHFWLIHSVWILFGLNSGITARQCAARVMMRSCVPLP